MAVGRTDLRDAEVGIVGAGIVGAGIVGAGIARALALAGARDG